LAYNLALLNDKGLEDELKKVILNQSSGYEIFTLYPDEVVALEKQLEPIDKD
jgi:hypothetical protein